MKTLYLICVGLFFLGVVDLPIGYYTFLRIVVTFTAVYGIIKEYKGEVDFWMVSLGIVVILFNPLVPVHLGSKGIWRVIDVICGVLFLVKGLKIKNQTK